jgi:Zn finger protein HypA/HybF involved in hydrogenase expression
MKIKEKIEEVRLKFICPECGTKRITRRERTRFQETSKIYGIGNGDRSDSKIPLVSLVVECRKCHVSGVNNFEYLETLDFLLPYEMKDCSICEKETKKLFLFIGSENSEGQPEQILIICEDCKPEALAEGFEFRPEIKIY